MEINSKEYWEKRFVENWEKCYGVEQTSFFAKIACELLPIKIVNEIREKNYSVCDMGCALGDGVNILSEFLKINVDGADFSREAVDIATKKYPQNHFRVLDMTNIPEGTQYDVVFSSNVLEHFSCPWNIFENLSKVAKKYIILMVPFEEELEIDEHLYQFREDNIPLSKCGYNLVYSIAFDARNMEETYYPDNQIMLIYAKHDSEEMQIYIKDVNAKNGLLQERIEQKNKEIEQKDIKIQQIELEKEQIIDSEEKSRNELICKYNKKIEQLQCEREEENRNYAEYIESKRDVEKDLIKQINIVQASKTYRYGLVLKRFYAQCIKSSEKRDFFKWLCGKITHKETTAKLLSEFDHLETAKQCLRVEHHTVNHKPVVVESATIKLKTTKSVVIFASVPFFDVGGGQRSAQLARTFNALGYRVHYIYGFPCTEENVPDMFIPTEAHEYIDNISKEWFIKRINEESIVIFEIPYAKFEPYLKLANKVGCLTVYEHIDNWDSSLGCLFYDEVVYKNFLEKVGLITVTAKMLGEKIEEKIDREYLYLPNAVNIEIFEPLKTYACPSDLVKGKRKTLLYFGSLWGEWFEWDKIDYLAKQCPDCAINLIGDYSGCVDRVKNARKNVHFLGLKKQTDLPAYLQHSDVALLPFKNCEIGKYVSPLKIFEYIAMNVKVIATNLDDIQNYPNVYCSDSKEDWVSFLNEETELIDSSTFISDNNWFARCAELIKRANIKEKNFPEISIVVLNYNNMTFIRRCVETLLAHKSRYNYEIVVVDNGSKDGSYEMLKENYSEKIVLVQNTKNGCSSGRNLGVKNSKGEYICFLDSDQWVISDYWLDSAIELFEKNSKLGAVSWAGGWFSPGTPAGTIVDYLPNRGMDTAAVWYRMDIGYLGTDGFLIKRKLFDEINGFDEFYDPTCFEDTDISLKVRYHGYELAYCPYMSIMHLPHQTTKSGSAGHTKLMKRNGDYFVEKWKKLKPELLEYYF